ncbi:MAG: cytochrome c biogenesis protein CcsA [Leptospiraceae bacterium]|nr:cytochrome c biogenesis protein CcsA [Leptospiraceae bacterium]MCP5495046.1 cytochrome c biogenesis protein CcsA [Leptospiraceae bacterium]
MRLKLLPRLYDYILYLIFILVFPSSVLLSLYYPNVILNQGLSHRIFYFHVAVAWVSLYAPILASVFGFLYLIKKNLKWDILSFSANTIAVLFSICVLFSGPIWAKSAWGIPWDWTDARLQSFFVLVITLVAYFITRGLIQGLNTKATISSFLSVLCALTALLTWGAIRWIENPGNHPESVLGKGGMDWDMKLVFWHSIFSYHILFLIIFSLIYRQARLNSLLEYLKETSNE